MAKMMIRQKIFKDQNRILISNANKILAKQQDKTKKLLVKIYFLNKDLKEIYSYLLTIGGSFTDL